MLPIRDVAVSAPDTALRFPSTGALALIWYGSISAVPDDALSCLDEEERARGTRRRRGWDGFLRAHAAVRHAIAEHVGDAPDAIEFTGPRCDSCGHRHGPPQIRQLTARQLFVSTSHSDDLWMAAVSSTAVGVDIEAVDAVTPGVRTLSFTPEERTLLGGGAASIEGWVAKEASAKALGQGLARDLRSLRWYPAPDGSFTIMPGTGGLIRGTTAPLTSSHVCAIAVSGTPHADITPPLRLTHWIRSSSAPWRHSAALTYDGRC